MKKIILLAILGLSMTSYSQSIRGLGKFKLESNISILKEFGFTDVEKTFKVDSIMYVTLYAKYGPSLRYCDYIKSFGRNAQIEAGKENENYIVSEFTIDSEMYNIRINEYGKVIKPINKNILEYVEFLK